MRYRLAVGALWGMLRRSVEENENGSKSASFVRNQHHGGTHTDVTKLETWKFACNNVLHVSFKALPIHQHVSLN